MREKPPCKVDGIDCPKRYVGCKAECDDWQKWLAAHNAEMEIQRTAKKRMDDINVFEFQRSLRERRDTKRRRAQERRDRRG